jgi:transcriptional regulator with XRE-family HTH domain
MTNEQQREPINHFRITSEDWKLYFTKIFNSVPRESKEEKHLWLADKAGVSVSSTTQWLAKGILPRAENLFEIAEVLLKIPLTTMISQIQYGIDPPSLTSDTVDRRTIEAIANVPSTDYELIGSSLGGMTQAQLYGAAGKLIEIAKFLP